MRAISFTTPILTTAILSPICSSNLGMSISTFSSFYNLFSMFCNKVNLLLQFFWPKRFYISLIWISHVGGNLGNNLFLNYVSELSINWDRASISCILHRELANILLRFKDLLLLCERIIADLLCSLSGICYNTSMTALFMVVSLF